MSAINNIYDYEGDVVTLCNVMSAINNIVDYEGDVVTLFFTCYDADVVTLCNVTFYF